MARMIPALPDPETKSKGELESFEKLKSDPGTSNWIVMHSLAISQHVKQVVGEADFVVVVPAYGVLCLEVKGTQSIRREQGLWYYGKDPNADPRGPFKQASEAMHSIRKRVAAQDNSLASVLFWSAVALPYVDLSIISDEWHPWQLLNGTKLSQRPISELIVGILRKASEHVQTHGGAWHTPDRKEPSRQQCETIAKILRPDFEFFIAPQMMRKQVEKEVKHYTQEQFDALDAMESNPRVVFSGPAGTGKTLLAIEAARRSCVDGKRVLLLCFNKNLGMRLVEETRLIGANLAVFSLHKYMMRIADLAQTELSGVTSEFWQNELPERAIGHLLAADTEQYLFDEIIIDEAQDILRTNYLDFLDLSVRGGLRAGKWRLFGDFEKQAIYESASNITFQEALGTRLGNPTTFSLRNNCRNTPRVTSLVQLLSNLVPGYTRILRPDDGIEPHIRYYSNESEQVRLLADDLEALLTRGYAYADIVILSTRANLHSVATSLGPPWRDKMRPAEDATGNFVRYGTVHAFKGLESPAVIVTDVDGISGPKAASLFYVAITRTLQSLSILASDSVRKDILRILIG